LFQPLAEDVSRALENIVSGEKEPARLLPDAAVLKKVPLPLMSR